MVRINSDKMIKNPGKRFFAGHQSGEEALPGNSYVNSYVMAETACGQADGGRQTSGLQRPGFTWTLWYFLFVLLSITSGSSSYYYQLLPVLLPITINYFRFFRRLFRVFLAFPVFPAFSVPADRPEPPLIRIERTTKTARMKG